MRKMKERTFISIRGIVFIALIIGFLIPFEWYSAFAQEKQEKSVIHKVSQERPVIQIIPSKTLEAENKTISMNRVKKLGIKKDVSKVWGVVKSNRELPEERSYNELSHENQVIQNRTIQVPVKELERNMIIETIQKSDDSTPENKTLKAKELSISSTQASGDNLWNIRINGDDRFHSNEAWVRPWRYNYEDGWGKWVGNYSYELQWGSTYTQSSGNLGSFSWNTGSNGSLSLSGNRDIQWHAWTYVYVGSNTTISLQGGGDCVPRVFLNEAFDSPIQFPANLSLVAGWNRIDMTGYNQNQGYSFNMSTELANYVNTMNSAPVSQPNLTAQYIPSGWDYPIVVSSITGTNTDGPNWEAGTFYIDIMVAANNSSVDVTTPFVNRFYIDGQLSATFNFPSGLNAGYYGVYEDLQRDLTPGTHTLKLVVDADNDVNETDESQNDNTYERTVSIIDVPLPDLIVSTGGFSPTTVSCGQTFTMQATVQNIGSQTAGVSRLDYYLSTDIYISTSDYKLGEITVESLGAGVTSAVKTLTVTFPSTIPSGTYYAGWICDAVNQVTESDENNGFYLPSPQVTVQQLPDLIITTAGFSPTTISCGQTFNMQATVKNDGCVTAGSIQLDFFLSNDTSSYYLCQVWVEPLGAGASFTKTCTIVFPSTIPSGTYYLGMILDATYNVTESDENNFFYLPNPQVTVQQLPDLIVYTGGVTPTTISCGQTLTIWATVKNVGCVTAGSSQLDYYLSTDTYISTSDYKLGGTTVESLGAGVTSGVKTVTVTFPSTIPSGSYYVGFICDAAHQVMECDENNGFYLPNPIVIVQQRPDLTVTTANFTPTNITCGQTLTINATVRNDGCSTAGSSRMDYYLTLDTILDPGDPKLGETNAPFLGVGATSNQQLVIPSFPDTISSGMYYVAFYCDAAYQVTEGDENNGYYLPSPQLIVNPCPCNADFVGDPRQGPPGTVVIFTDQSTGATSWSWSFPGGTPPTATGKGPHHVTYHNSGLWDVTLNIVCTSGSDVETKPNYINIPFGIIGDVNDDGFCNSTDALIILSCDVGINVSQFCPMNCGDVNGDGYINSTDALIILSYDVGISVPFPVGQAGCPQNVTPCPGCNP